MPATRTFSSLLLGALLGFLAVGDDAAAQEVSLDDLAKRGAASLKKLEEKPARWQGRFHNPSGVKLELTIVSAPPSFDLRMTVRPPGSPPQKLLHVLSHEEKWYVSEQGRARGVYRPWAAPFDNPSAPIFISEVWPRAYARSEGDRFAGTDEEGTAIVLTQVTGERRAMLEKMLADVAELGESRLTPENAAQLKEVRYVLENGMPIAVDPTTGLLRVSGTAKMQIELSPVKWLSEAPAFDVPEGMKDHTAPLPKERADLVMIGHNGLWRPGLPSGDFDARLLDLKTRELRRVPYRGWMSMPGCFTKDRSGVVVTGVTEGTWGLFFIDLESGENRRLGGDALKLGMIHGPAVSPDGKSVAVLHMGGGGVARLQMQLYLVDLASGEARPIGETFDGHSFSWLADGSGLIGVTRRHISMDEPSEASIARFDLDGKVTKLRLGDFPQLVGAERDRILFLGDENLWYTCDLEGKNEKKLGDGLSRHHQPTVSPDGTRVLILRFTPGRGPRPVVLDLEGKELSVIDVGPGVWVQPAWR